MADWVFTDNPDDPCAYDVQWEEPDDPFGSIDDSRPYWPDGSTAERIYRFTHAACMDAVIEYTSEAES